MKKKIMLVIVAAFVIIHGLYGLWMLTESLLYGVLWLCIGFVEGAIASFVVYLGKTREKLSMSLLTGFVAWLAVLLVFDIVIMLGSISFGTGKADKVIVLGYALKNDTATETLLNRMSTAYGYAQDNKEAKFIVTGGVTGKNSKSEAEVMKSILVSYGVDSLRVFEETQAKSTVDNMKYSKELISSQDKVVLISSNYHCLRAKLLAGKFGYSVKTVGAPAPLKLVPNQLLLEKISIVQILLFGVK